MTIDDIIDKLNANKSGVVVIPDLIVDLRLAEQHYDDRAYDAYNDGHSEGYDEGLADGSREDVV